MSQISLPKAKPRSSSPALRAIQIQTQVLWALMLHDIKSRFFGNGLGYVVTILWPSVHIAVIVGFYVLGKRPVPYGSSSLLYASIGVLPYIGWNYMSRFTMIGMLQNRSFLSYPIIKPLDMMFARLALECVSIYIITVGLIAVNALCQVNVVPLSITDAACGIFSAVLLGIGFGVFNSAIAMIFPLWVTGYVLILILFWFTAGLAFNPEDLPENVSYYLAFNPLLHSIEWLRLAYYPDFPAHLLSKPYVIGCGAGSLALGLIAERVLKPYMKL